MSILSERLRELREDKQLTMSVLAQKIGVSDAAICKWENCISEPKASNIKNLSDFFEVSSDYLLGLENEFGAKKYFPPQIVFENTSIEEKQLLEYFKSVNHDYQIQIIEYARFIVERVKNTKRKK